MFNASVKNFRFTINYFESEHKFMYVIDYVIIKVHAFEKKKLWKKKTKEKSESNKKKYMIDWIQAVGHTCCCFITARFLFVLFVVHYHYMSK